MALRTVRFAVMLFVRWTVVAVFVLSYVMRDCWPTFRAAHVSENTTKLECASVEDEIASPNVSADLAAADELHDQIEAVHEAAGRVDRELEAADIEHLRLLALLNAERVLFAQLAAQQHMLLCEVASMSELIGSSVASLFERDSCQFRDAADVESALPGASQQSARVFGTQIARQGQIASLLAIAEEDLRIINTTDASVLRRDVTARERDISRLNVQLPKDKKSLNDRRVKQQHAQLHRHPGLTSDDRLNATALAAALARHAAKWWVARGWERFLVNLRKDWRSTLRAMCWRKRVVWARWFAHHRKQTRLVVNLETFVWAHVQRVNASSVARLGITLDTVVATMSDVGGQGVQIGVELFVVLAQLGHYTNHYLRLWDRCSTAVNATVSHGCSLMHATAPHLARALAAARSTLDHVRKAAADRVQRAAGLPVFVRASPNLTLLLVCLLPLAVLILRLLLRIPPLLFVRQCAGDVLQVLLYVARITVALATGACSLLSSALALWSLRAY